MSLEQTTHNELDLYEVAQALWQVKSSIALITILFVGATFAVLNLMEPKFETKIQLTIQNDVPFTKNELVIEKYRDFFYNQNYFNRWKKGTNTASNLSFDFIDREVRNNGLSFQKDRSELSTYFEEYGLTVRSNDINILRGVYSYMEFINNAVSKDYLQSRTSLSENLIKPSTLNLQESEKAIGYIIDLQVFIGKIASGQSIFIINKPLKPKMVFPRLVLLLPLAAILGFIFSSSFFLILNSIKSRQNS